MPIIGNLTSYQKVLSSSVLANETSPAGSPARGYSWTLSTNDLSGSVIGTDVFLIPPNQNSYTYTGLGGKSGVDTGLTTLIAAPANGKSEISPINGTTGDPTITFATTGGYGGGTTSTFLYVELNGVVLANNTSPGAHTFTLTLGSSQAGWVTANSNTLKYRIYHVGAGNPVNAGISVTISDDGIIIANIG